MARRKTSTRLSIRPLSGVKRLVNSVRRRSSAFALVSAEDQIVERCGVHSLNLTVGPMATTRPARRDPGGPLGALCSLLGCELDFRTSRCSRSRARVSVITGFAVAWLSLKSAATIIDDVQRDSCAPGDRSEEEQAFAGCSARAIFISTTFWSAS